MNEVLIPAQPLRLDYNDAFLYVESWKGQDLPSIISSQLQKVNIFREVTDQNERDKLIKDSAHNLAMAYRRQGITTAGELAEKLGLETPEYRQMTVIDEAILSGGIEFFRIDEESESAVNLDEREAGSLLDSMVRVKLQALKKGDPYLYSVQTLRMAMSGFNARVRLAAWKMFKPETLAVQEGDEAGTFWKGADRKINERLAALAGAMVYLSNHDEDRQIRLTVFDKLADLAKNYYDPANEIKYRQLRPLDYLKSALSGEEDQEVLGEKLYKLAELYADKDFSDRLAAVGLYQSNSEAGKQLVSRFQKKARDFINRGSDAYEAFKLISNVYFRAGDNTFYSGLKEYLQEEDFIKAAQKLAEKEKAEGINAEQKKTLRTIIDNFKSRHKKDSLIPGIEEMFIKAKLIERKKAPRTDESFPKT
ncbi:MAG: hypothetical protein UV73_C0008G0026 [Candidatus Gottesmanbacteria bacterium GW2011_GWA2_43_14]|uniref:Uncharacterized protein n=1 Tax=Candidatus Gottesmanbacteria bacterium GW2011_GWA2_43_14 TaxID=1618443 RepID=A0A0G1FR46_9BACT|nr:MAG: hypothetical protein UV73_C0008G0026 [Candidatus Gottesmanbacteria bacterium GW2011_GWA2_43_14]